MKHVLDNTIDRLTGASGLHEHVPELGERAWRVVGRYGDVIYWDLGNGWCDIMRVVPQKGHESWAQWFFTRIEASDDA